jgi:autotransporter-associated beta strand protein
MKSSPLLPIAAALAVSAFAAFAGIQAPRLTATLTNRPIVFSVARLNPLRLDGALATNDVITLGVTNGALTLAGSAGLTFTNGDGTADAAMAFQGTLASVNAALDGLCYQPGTNYVGGDALRIAISGSQSTNQALLITVSPSLDLTAAQNAILSGVGTNLSSSLATGTRLVPFGRAAGGLFYRTMSSVWWENNPWPVMAAAANWGRGRLVVLQKNAVSWNLLATNSETTSFLNQSVRWASRTSGTTAVIRASSASTVTWLQGQGFAASQSASWWTNLAGVNLVMLSGSEINDWTTKSAAILALRDFALSGGGVIIHGDSTCADEVFDTGIFDSNNTTSSGYVDAFTAVLRPGQDSGILRAVDRALDATFTSAATDMAAKELDEFDRIFTVLSVENYSAVRGEILAFNAANFQPTPAAPVSGTWPLRLLGEENTYLQLLPAAQTPKFRTADAVYGAITPDIPRVREWVCVEAQSAVPWQQPYSTARIRKRQATGLYAPPGEVVTVRFPSEVVGKGLQVFVGNNPGLVDYSSAKELPNNIRYFAVNSAEVPVANAMGGAVFVQVPDHWTLGSFSVEVLGAVRHPYFRLGRHTNAQWMSEIRSRVPNCLIIEGDRSYNMLGAEFARNIDDIETVARFWEDSMVWFHWQRGWERSPFKPLPFPVEQYATLSTVWGFNSGITANFSYGNWDSLIATNNLWTGYNGYHHESGHSHEQEFYATTGARPWYPNGDSETYANVLPFAPIVHMGLNGPKVSDGHDTIPMWRRQAFSSAWSQLVWDGTGYDWATTQGVYTDNGGRMGFWAIMGHEFNWRFFREMTLAGQTNTLSMTQVEGNDWRLKFLSQYFQHDLSAYLAFLGVTNSAAGIASVAGLPVWKPICGAVEATSTPANTPLTFNFTLATNVFSLDGVATLVSVSSPRHGTAINNGDGTATYTPESGFQGYDAYLFTLQSSTGDRSLQEMVVTVGTPAAPNTRPAAVTDLASTTTVAPVTVAVLANDSDPDGDAIYLWRVECPLYGTATNNGDGTITYQPDAGFYGTDQFTYVIHDGRGGEHRARVFVNVVSPNNRTPALTSSFLPKKDAAAGAPYSDTISANASDTDAWDRLAFAKTSGPAWLIVNPDGSLGGQPEQSDLGTNNFTVRISDDRGATTNATLQIIVRDLAWSSLLAWWKFDEGSGTTASDASGHGYNGSLASLTWTTDRFGAVGKAVNFPGTAAGLMTIANGGSLAAPWSATFWVKRTGNKASAALLDDTARSQSSLRLEQYSNTHKAGFSRYGTGDTSFNYTSPIGSWVHLTFVGTATGTALYVNGVLVDSQATSFPLSMKEISGAQDPLYAAVDDSRVYRFALSAAQVSQVYSNLTLSGFNPPVFSASLIKLPSGNEGQTYSNSFASFATDADGDALTFTKLGGANWLTVATDGTLSGVPAAGCGGTNVVYVEVADPKGGSATATVQIPVNGAPQFLFNPLAKPPAKPSVAWTNSLVADATDPNPGDTLVFAKVSGPAWLNVASGGALTGTPATGDVGLNAFTVRVTDAGGLSATATLNVLVSTTPPLMWTGDGADDLWSRAANWSGSVPTNGQSLLFLGAQRQQNTNNLLTSVGQVVFQNDGFAVSGNSLSLKGGLLNIAGDNAWNLNSTLASAQSFVSSNGTLTIGGTLSNGGFALNVDGAGSVRLAGLVTGSGGLTKSGAGTVTLGTANSYTGANTINGGRLVSTVSCWYSARGIGSGSLTINSGAVAQFTATHGFGYGSGGQSATINGGALQFDRENYVSGLTLNGGSIVGSGEFRTVSATYTVGSSANTSLIATPVNLVSSCTFNVANGAAAVDLRLSGVLSGSGGFTKSGAGLLQVAGSSTYSGVTAISTGTLQVDGSLGTNTVTVANTATLSGPGVVPGTVTVQSGATLAPGTGIGTLTSGPEVWNSGGKLLFEWSDAASSAGRDWLSIAGTLNVQATAGSKFTVKLVSLTASNTPGPITGFNTTASNSWTLATASGGVLNFDSAKFSVDASAFSNDFTGGSFLVATQGNSLVLNYLPPPVVIMTSPTPGTSFVPPATISLAATVSSNGHSIAKVQFFDGAALLSDDTAPPYAYVWSGVGPGVKSLSAVAVGDSGSVTSAVVTVTVWDPAPPQLTAGLSGRDISLRLAGTVGQHYRVEFTPALPAAPWQTLTDLTALAESPFAVTDSATNSLRFYRAVSLP